MVAVRIVTRTRSARCRRGRALCAEPHLARLNVNLTLSVFVLWFLSAHSVSRLPLVCTLRYLVLPGVKQATFTGAQLRAGAAAYGFMTAGFFGPGNWPVLEAKAKAQIANSAAAQPVQDIPEPAYDWMPYFARFRDALPEDGVTSTLVAFGELMNSLHGYNEASPRPSREERAASVLQQAQDFVLGLLEPLFGSKHTPKLHETLCHACDEILLREDLSMADTSLKEQKHKGKKAGYKLTNLQTETAGRQ